jgi:hypothetical protein
MIPGEAIAKFQILLTFSDMKAIYDAEAFTATDFVALVAVKKYLYFDGVELQAWVFKLQAKESSSVYS